MAHKNAHEPKLPTQRQLRAGEIIRHALVTLLARGDLRDPELEKALITVSEVRMSSDLRVAKVYVAPLGPGEPQALAKALNRGASFLRGRLGREIELKFTPELHFHADNSYDTASYVDQLLARPQVQRDLRGDDEPTPDE